MMTRQSVRRYQKGGARDNFGNDTANQSAESVVTKCSVSGTFGNDTTPENSKGNDQSVVTKSEPSAAFGNDTAMFVRVRKRKLTYGDTSASYDLVHAVRINGKARQQFLLGLGSLKTPPRHQHMLMWFWHRALGRMRRHGLSETKRKSIVAAMIAKGATKPTRKRCKGHIDGWPHMHFDFTEFYPGCVSKISQEESDLRTKALLASVGISPP
jgi:hypothetical protein